MTRAPSSLAPTSRSSCRSSRAQAFAPAPCEHAALIWVCIYHHASGAKSTGNLADHMAGRKLCLIKLVVDTELRPVCHKPKPLRTLLVGRDTRFRQAEGPIHIGLLHCSDVCKNFHIHSIALPPDEFGPAFVPGSPKHWFWIIQRMVRRGRAPQPDLRSLSLLPDAPRRHQHLFDLLGFTNGTELLRRCERATADRSDACTLFWTLGANQVGKAAINGWQEVIIPRRAWRRRA